MTDPRPTRAELAAAARERARRSARAFATREAPLRRCPHCGAQERTPYERCPACGESYLKALPRLSRATRTALVLLAGAGAVVAFVALVLLLGGQAADNAARERARRAAAVAAERRRLSREQTPHHARATGVPLPRAGADPVAGRAARHAMLVRLEEAITADARSRIARGELEASRVRTTRCVPLVPGRPVADEDDLRRPLGRYSCLAVTQRGRAAAADLGLPFVAVIDFRRATFTWCKDNPAGAAEVESRTFVRLARECTAARGPAFGSGYLIEPPKG